MPLAPDRRTAALAALSVTLSLALVGPRAATAAVSFEQLPGTAGCISSVPNAAALCVPGHDMGGLRAVAVSQDGRNVYASGVALLTYDRNGGYGHRDHVRVHEVGERAAYLAGTPRVLEATVPRDTIARAVRLAAKVYPFPPEFDLEGFTRAFSARAEITHRVPVWRYAAQKRASTRSTVSLQLGQRITGAGRTPRIRRTAPAPPCGRSLLGGGGLVPAAGGGRIES